MHNDRPSALRRTPRRKDSGAKSPRRHEITSVPPVASTRTLTLIKVGITASLLMGAANICVATVQNSAWFLVTGTFFLISGLARLVAYLMRRQGSTGWQRVTLRTGGIFALLMAVNLSLIVLISISEAHNPIRGTIAGIASATYSFALLGSAIYNALHARAMRPAYLTVIRSIVVIAAIGSLYSTECLMLGTFNNGYTNVMLFEAPSGAAGVLAAVLMALSLFRRER